MLGCEEDGAGVVEGALCCGKSGFCCSALPLRRVEDRAPIDEQATSRNSTARDERSSV